MWKCGQCKIKVTFYTTDIDILRVTSMHRIVIHCIDISIHIDRYTPNMQAGIRWCQMLVIAGEQRAGNSTDSVDQYLCISKLVHHQSVCHLRFLLDDHTGILGHWIGLERSFSRGKDEVCVCLDDLIQVFPRRLTAVIHRDLIRRDQVTLRWHVWHIKTYAGVHKNSLISPTP